jgi:DNA helicase-2/ATP-dependent DNA helicase PcrA
LLFPGYPHHRAGAITREGISRRIVNFTMFGDPRPHRWHEHRIQLVSSDEALNEAVSLVARTRRGKRRTWRVETSRKDYDKGLEFARSLCQVADLEVVRRARLTPGKAFHFMPASHVRPGMVVPVLRGDAVREARVSSVEIVPYAGFVYDLTVQHLRNYPAGGLIVHNSVYRWRGADLRNILDFEHDYPGTRVIRLEQNYRSTGRILAAAAAVIANNVARKKKTLWTENPDGSLPVVFTAWDEHAEASFVAQNIRRLRAEGAEYGDVAVFYRTNAQSRVIEDALRRAGLPYVIIGSVRFYERKEIKDAVAYLRLVVNPTDDLAFRRAVGAPTRGIGRSTLQRLDEAARRAGRSLLEASASLPPDITGKPRAGLLEFARLVASLAGRRASMPLAGFLEEVLNASGYADALIEERTAEAQGRLENLKELVAAAEEFERSREDPSLEAFLDSIALVSDVDEYDQISSAVTLMTLHSAKGLEFPVVFLTGMEEGVFPHTRAMGTADDVEEERRLCYVGITRAKRVVYLTHALNRRLHGGGPSEPSRFLFEIPQDQVVVLGTRAFPAPMPPVATPVSTDADDLPFRVGARVRHAKWGEGLLVGIERDGQDVMVTVGFASVGRKRMLLSAAHLEEIE